MENPLPNFAAQASLEHSCASCGKSQDSLGGQLMRCAACKSAFYCSQFCQKKAWPTHKKFCMHEPKRSARASATNSGIKLSAGQPAEPFLASLQGLSDKTYLQSLPRQEVFKQLIDAYRLRIEDEYTFEGEAGGLYAGDDPFPSFQRFLNKAERKSVVPSWWDVKARQQCERLALDYKKAHCIHHAVEKSDIQEAYSDPMMPMKLRMLAEKVYSRSLGGDGSDRDDDDEDDDDEDEDDEWETESDEC